MSFVSNIVLLFLGFFLLRLLGQGSMSLSSSTLVAKWFDERKGKALSITSLGGLAGAAILPPVNTWLIKVYSWQMTWRVWSLLLWCVMAPAALFLIRDTPEDIGLHPDNNTSEKSPSDSVKNVCGVSWKLKDAIHTRCFWLLIYVVFVFASIATGLVFHQISILNQRGLSREISALVLSAMALSRIPIQLFVGHLSDEFPNRYLLAFSMIVLFLAMIVLNFVGSLFLALAYGVLLGLSLAFVGVSIKATWPEYFGRRHVGSIQGFSYVATVIGSSFGPLPFGYAYDLFGSYTKVLLLCSLLPVLGVIAAFTAKPPTKNVEIQE